MATSPDTAIAAELSKDRRTQRYRLAWRWHFYAGLFTVPFLLTLAITGLIMVYSTAIKTPVGGTLSPPPNAQAATPSEMMQTLEVAFPDAEISQYIPASSATATAQFQLTDSSGKLLLAALNPYSNTILATVDPEDSLYALAHSIHGTLLMGEFGDLLIETAAGLAALLLLSGIYMWLLRRGESKTKSNAKSKQSSRLRWRHWHLSTGLYAGLGLAFFILSGLAWSSVWGGKMVQAWGSFPAEKWGPVGLSTEAHQSMNHGSAKEVPWGLEQTLLPQSQTEEQGPAKHGNHHSGATATSPLQTSLSLSEIDLIARQLGFGPRYRINLPRDARGVYTIAASTMTGDARSTAQERTVHVDQYSGEILAEVDFADYSVLAKSMALGVGIHQGSMGWWNSLLNASMCMVVIFLCVSGTLMWWLRKPSSRLAPSAPPRAVSLPMRNSFSVLLLICALSFPLLGAVLIVAGLVELVISRRQSTEVAAH